MTDGSEGKSGIKDRNSEVRENCLKLGKSVIGKSFPAVCEILYHRLKGPLGKLRQKRTTLTLQGALTDWISSSCREFLDQEMSLGVPPRVPRGRLSTSLLVTDMPDCLESGLEI